MKLFSQENSNKKPFSAIDRPPPRGKFFAQELSQFFDRLLPRFLFFLSILAVLILFSAPVGAPFVKNVESAFLFFPFLTLALAAAILLAVIRNLFITKKFHYTRDYFSALLVGLIFSAVAAQILGGGKHFFGLNQQSVTPTFLAYFFGILLLLLIYNWRSVLRQILSKFLSEGEAGPRSLGFLKKIYFLASTVSASALAAGVIIRRELADSLPIFLPLIVFNFFLYFLLSLSSSGKEKKLLIISLLPHFIILLLGQNNLVWLSLALVFFVVLLWQAFSGNKEKIIYLLFALVLAITLFSVNLFWDKSPLGGKETPNSVSRGWQIAASALKEKNFLPAILGFSANKADSILSADQLTTKSLPEILSARSEGGGPALLLLSFGIAGLVIWLLALFSLFHKSFFFASAKSDWQKFIFLLYLLVLFEFFFLPWTFFSFWLFVFLSGLILFLQPPATEKELPIGGGKIFRWARNLAFFLFLAVFLAGFFTGARLSLATMFAQASQYSQAEQTRLSRLTKAARLNPWNESYAANLARQRLASAANYANVVQQKSLLETISRSAKISVDESEDGRAAWQAARLYKDLEAYALGSVLLARPAYLKALALLPKNLALRLEAAQFYRENFSSLVSGGHSSDALFAEIRQILEPGLALDEDWLPLRPELAFLVEQQEGIASALALLQPWEEASVEIKFHVGRLHYNDGNLPAALEKFLQITRIDPNYSNAHYSLGLVYYRQNRLTDSLREFEAVLAINPGSQDVSGKIQAIKDEITGQEDPAAPLSADAE